MPEDRKPSWERHLQTGIMTILLGLLVFVASEYSSQDKRMALAEAQLWTAAQDRITANQRLQRLEDRTDENMKEIRELIQKLYDRIDKKADK